MKDAAIQPVRTFYDWAAWWSLVAPLATAPVAVAAVTTTSRLGYTSFISFIFGGELIILLAAAVLGIISVFAVGRHTRKISIWMAITGILLGCGFGLVDLVLLALSSPNC